MLTECPSCLRSYRLSCDALGTHGRTVVCPACECRWYVAAPDAGPHLPSAVEFKVRPMGRPAPALRRMTYQPLLTGMLGLGMMIGLIGERGPIVKALPAAARLYAALGLSVNVRGLSLGDIKAVRLEESSGRIAISGLIRNVTQARAPVPRMTFDLRDARGAVLASWGENPPKRSLAAKETLAFTTQAPSLPTGGTDIIIRFTDARPQQALLAASSSNAD